MKYPAVLAMAVLAVLSTLNIAHAHETRPFYLEIKETAPGRYSLMWRAPLYYGQRLPVQMRLPDGVRVLTKPIQRVFPDSIIEQMVIEAGPDGLPGRRIFFDGLREQAVTDVLVRATLLDGSQWTVMARPSQPWIDFKRSMAGFEAARAYLVMGIKHILLGVDHLLFVLGLMLLSRGFGLLVKTITSFTVGHSVSLALATLGAVYVPPKPLSATIALSIVFLAAELVRAQRGERTITIRNPWLVSFAFGLLHGLGFAGALVQLGLPKSAIPMALLLFNVGVEIGQILFVLVALLVIGSLRKMEFHPPSWGKKLPVYTMGSIAGFWFVGRLAAM